MRLKSNIWQRLRMVGNILCFSVVAKMKKHPALPATIIFCNADGDTVRGIMHGHDHIALTLPTSRHEGTLYVQGSRRKLILMPQAKDTEQQRYLELVDDKEPGNSSLMIKDLKMELPGYYEKVYPQKPE